MTDPLIAVRLAPPQTRGFDCNTPVTTRGAKTFAGAGYRFAVRYVPRVTAKPHDLSAAETIRIMQAGLGLMAVQHYEGANWRPTPDKGTRYGQTAAEHLRACGMTERAMCWLDLEEVNPEVDTKTVIAYCNNWYDAVSTGGFTPGLYVGFGCRLSPNELYYRLKFRRYWAAYNLNTDQYPAVRGVQMRQRSSKAPTGVDFAIDSDTAQADRKGDVPLVMAPADWLENRP